MTVTARLSAGYSVSKRTADGYVNILTAQEVVGRSWWASRSIDTKAGARGDTVLESNVEAQNRFCLHVETRRRVGDDWERCVWGVPLRNGSDSQSASEESDGRRNELVHLGGVLKKSIHSPAAFYGFLVSLKGNHNASSSQI